MGWTTLLQQQKGVLAAGEQQRGEGYVHPWAASTIESQPASPAGSSEEGRQAPDSLTRWASKERILIFLILTRQRVNELQTICMCVSRYCASNHEQTN